MIVFLSMHKPCKNESLIESQRKLAELAKQLLEAKTHINQLEKEKTEMLKVKAQQEQEKTAVLQVQAQPQTEQTTADMETLEAKIERLIEEKLSKALSKLAIAHPTESKPRTQASAKQPEVIDWSGMSNADLWTTKVKGASEEKIRRSYEGIALYNDTVATGDDDRLALTNQALRELSGVNGLLVGEWIKSHADEVITHNSKHGMQNAKDPSKVETYYNKRHGAERITKILNSINERFLDGEALKSRTLAQFSGLAQKTR